MRRKFCDVMSGSSRLKKLPEARGITGKINFHNVITTPVRILFLFTELYIDSIMALQTRNICSLNKVNDIFRHHKLICF